MPMFEILIEKINRNICNNLQREPPKTLTVQGGNNPKYWTIHPIIWIIPLPLPFPNNIQHNLEDGKSFFRIFIFLCLPFVS